jgi:transketolase
MKTDMRVRANGPALDWSDTDGRAVDLIRVLAMDAVEQAGSGHPGTAMSLAPAAYLLFQKVMRHDPADPAWLGRDRFVLSCGHSSLTLYIQLYLVGYGVTLDDLRRYRSWGSITPGHPEHGLTPGVETTTGPLGQGLANAVGMAMAARRGRGLLDPDAGPGASPFDHHVYAIMSDGDIEEGISHEASSLAGHQQLGNLVVIYDDNTISIEDDTNIAKSEDVCGRYAAYGWHVQKVSFRATDRSDNPGRPGGYHEDVQALYAALLAARSDTTAPSLISLRTIIGWPTPTKQNTGAAHGSALGAAEVAATKEILGFDPRVSFPAEEQVVAHARAVGERGRAVHESWDADFAAWSVAHPEQRRLLDRLVRPELPDGWAGVLPAFPPDAAGMATRKASGAVLSALPSVLPELWGGSADLADSNDTTMKGEPSFIPARHQARMFPGDRYGRTLHFGIREHAMGAVLNGIALHGLSRPYGGTFLVFSDYMRPAVRLAALMHLPVTYLGRTSRPAGLCLTRQELPVLDRSADGPGLASAEGTARGGYVLAEADGGSPEVILIATGSEVPIALAARELLRDSRVAARVVSMPCLEWFAEQDADYREQVLPTAVRARVSIEAGITLGWRVYMGDAGASVGLEHFGASADYKKLYAEFGITAERAAAAALASLARLTGRADAAQHASHEGRSD